MSREKADNENLNKVKLFQDTVPRSRVQLDVVKKVRAAVKNMPADLPAKIIAYQDVINENGEYFLLYQGSSSLKPLVEYLNQNSISSEKLLQEMIEILKLLRDLDLIKRLFPKGINAANFYIDQQENIYLMPEQIHSSQKNYNNFDFEAPAAEYFKPPEIIAGQTWDQKAYIFNLAAVFYYFLTSKTIFGDDDQAKVLNKIQTENILEPKLLVPEISEQLNSLLMEMLDRDENERSNLDSVLQQLESAASAASFRLLPFLKRENLIENKVLKKKRQKENIKLFFRQSWKPLLFFVILFASIFWGLSSGPAPVITAEDSPAEVVNYFYEALAAKNIGLAKEAAAIDLGQMERLISESHVIEKMQTAYRNPEFGEEVNQVYSLENLRIEEVSHSTNSRSFKAFYEFNFRDREKLYSAALEDQLFVEKIDDIWRITAIKGDFKAMIDGKYPWREK
ncbi:MAG: hypothetical protein A8274_509 [Halanaerobium sp. 4-GBenrich]|jgi:hypothetical protein|uniref:Protein kinase domain-containing protein n=1 Tax=Halanaerobium congolense TaxID=54121 RepID=A0A1G8JNB0_9FIRM|nr:hypothetical protein [Halanaerobium congolense]KXS49212.1 MAG: hypothetical protein AWL62_1264 [Halanaerobium sp. T82-1]ODS50525.1 MAG: hypothetical protein A8274_509 [Halanaerobium sp. 4-GBenrich]OEG63404.1 MAG: hypothetical protein BHK79_08955 [Halanaerobium sp. MDAL1]PUU92806.1 MAG: hypothetical protein CI948_465 [Halanaerobium sp.]PXV65593.1 protein kinase-like protein [Halanaerobium congolense]